MNLELCVSLFVCVCVSRLQIHQDLREELAKVKTLEGLAGVSKQLRLRCQVTGRRDEEEEEKGSLSCSKKSFNAYDFLQNPDIGRLLPQTGTGVLLIGLIIHRCTVQEEIAKGKDTEEKEGSLPFPHWICQPYVRPA